MASEDPFKAALSEARKKQHAAISTLDESALEVGAERLFITLVCMLSMTPAGEARESTHGTVPAKLELLAYHLFPKFNQSSTQPMTPVHVDKGILALDSFFDSNMMAQAFSRMDTSEPSDQLESLLRRMLIDISVVRGSAYPEQTQQEIYEIQGHFEKWFEERLGIGPRRATDILLAILSTQEIKANNWRDSLLRPSRDLEEAWKTARRRKRTGLSEEEQILLSRFQSAKDAFFHEYFLSLPKHPPDQVPVLYNEILIKPEVSLREFQGLCDLIGCTVSTRSLMKSSIEMLQRPLFVLPTNGVLLADISNAFDQLWAAYDRIARADQNFYDRRYLKHKSEWLEQRIANNLERIFPSSHVYRNLTYPDPDKKEGGTAELDLAVHWDPFLILVEAKSAQFRLESQLGDVGRLRSDLKENVAEAFEQGRRAVRYLQSTTEALFKEKRFDRILRVNKDEIKRLYIMTVSQHLLANLATRLASLRPLGLFKDEEYPWALSIADLDTITQFSGGPDIFLHYAERRLAIQTEEVEIRADELDLFGAYLDTRLQPERLWKKGSERVNFVSLGGFQEKFDDVFKYRRGELDKAPEVSLNVPPVILEILNELRNYKDEKSARWIAFSLLTLNDKTLGAIQSMFYGIRKQEVSLGRSIFGVHSQDNVVISLTAALGMQKEILRRTVHLRTRIEKYRRKASKSIGFGIILSEDKIFDCAVWIEGPWVYNADLEQAIEKEPPIIPRQGATLPGRNNPCLCGSGKKFKKCCLVKIEAARRK